MADPINILLARLDGTAGFHVMHGSSTEIAVAALREITTDPNLLARASGAAFGAWQADPVVRFSGREKSRLLDAAGADLTVRDEVAAATRIRLSETGRLGHSAP